MAHLVSSAFRSLVLAQALMLGILAAGCTSEVIEESAEDELAGCDEILGDGCEPGEIQSCSTGVSEETLPGGSVGNMTCELVAECETRWGYCMVNTPLVLSFDNAPVTLLADDAHTFDVNGAASMITDWPAAATPWLAIDLDGNGRIDDGSELFGSMSALPGGGRATNGFIALRALDEDRDGRITPADPGFSRLLLWADRDGDRASAPEELTPAGARGLTAIELEYVSDPRCDARGNCEVERAAFTFIDEDGAARTGTVIDVHLWPQR